MANVKKWQEIAITWYFLSPLFAINEMLNFSNMENPLGGTTYHIQKALSNEITCSLLSVIVWVSVVLKRAVGVDIDWHFDNLMEVTFRVMWIVDRQPPG